MPMTTLTPVDAFSEPVQVEANGTTITKEGIGDLGLQRLADQATFLRNRLPGANAAVAITCPAIPRLKDTSGEWEPDSVEAATVQAIIGSVPLGFPLPALPPVGTLSRVDVVVHGSWEDGHIDLPAVMPQAKLYQKDLAGSGAGTLVGTEDDASSTLPAYEQLHVISFTGLAIDVADKVFDVRVVGESGANAVAKCFAVLALKFWVTP